MKKKLIFAIPLLILIPLSAFAEYATYDFIVGCGIDTIPKFILAVFGIIVKVGIPVASIFLIWAGFMFLTAQGNEAKLTAAKKSFLWSCIGFGILLGAWLLATAFEGVIVAFSGGNPESVTITPCREENPVTPLLTLPSGLRNFLANDRATHSGIGSIVGENTNPCALSGVGFTANDVMEDYNLSPTDPQLLNQSYQILHNEALHNSTEQAYMLVETASGASTLLHTGSGTSGGVGMPPIATIQSSIIDPSLSGVTSIHFMHTHPSAISNTMMPPSIDDLWGAYTYSSAFPGVAWSGDVADPTGVWSFSVPPGSALGQAMKSITDGLAAIGANSEAQAYYASRGITKCSSPAVVYQALNDILNGAAGSDAQQLAQNLVDPINVLQPFYVMDAPLPNHPTQAQFDAIMKQRLDLLNQLGVSLQFHQVTS